MANLPRRFVLQRNEDVHGVSGTGFIAEGCVFSNGYAVLTWLTPLTSVAMYHSIDVLEQVHGHEGKTTVVWIDDVEEKPKKFSKKIKKD